MTLRVKVLEPFDARGIAAFHGAAGLLMAAPFWIADTGAGRLGIMTLAAFFARLIQIMYGCFWLGIPILLAIWLSRQCQRRRVLFWSGFAFGACWVAGQMLPILLWKGELGEWFTLPHLMILVSIGGAFYGVGYVGTNFTFRQLAYRIEEQDGELCWICAYRVGNPPISDRCSECGNPIHPSTRPKLRRPLKQFTKRHSRKLTATVLIFVAVVLIAAAIKQRAETQSFRTSFEGKPVRGAVVQIDLTAIPPRWIGGWEAKGRWRPISTEPTNALVVYYIPNPYGAQPSMQIQLTGLVDTGGTTRPGWGNPAISCDLNRAQAEYVLENGVPQSLIDAMLQEATKAGWVPLPNGGTTNSLDVAPDGHFPAAKQMQSGRAHGGD